MYDYQTDKYLTIVTIVKYSESVNCCKRTRNSIIAHAPIMHGERREKGRERGGRERERERETLSRSTINTIDEDPRLSNIRIFIDASSFIRKCLRKHESSVSISNIKSNLSSLSPIYNEHG